VLAGKVTYQGFASGPGPVDVFGISSQLADRLGEYDMQGNLFLLSLSGHVFGKLFNRYRRNSWNEYAIQSEEQIFESDAVI
jgi:hypothetical protein